MTLYDALEKSIDELVYQELRNSINKYEWFEKNKGEIVAELSSGKQLPHEFFIGYSGLPEKFKKSFYSLIQDYIFLSRLTGKKIAAEFPSHLRKDFSAEIDNFTLSILSKIENLSPKDTLEYIAYDIKQDIEIWSKILDELIVQTESWLRNGNYRELFYYPIHWGKNIESTFRFAIIEELTGLNLNLDDPKANEEMIRDYIETERK